MNNQTTDIRSLLLENEQLNSSNPNFSNPQPMPAQPVEPQSVNNNIATQQQASQPFITKKIDTTLNMLPEENQYINDLNIDGAYNNIDKQLENATPTEKKIIKEKMTVNVGGETKVFLIIIAIIFIFIIGLPALFDLINSIKYR